MQKLGQGLGEVRMTVRLEKLFWMWGYLFNQSTKVVEIRRKIRGSTVVSP